ncbi:MAG TPA: isoprenylcysteine carboxylmethyltransferase family protein [Bryobacteraceae bacterium]|nr:isoprenylcysteine carboxylmethyltransferase family protein [Bryobacteraceae bacterium]
MRKLWAFLGSAVFLVIAPGFVAGLAPYWISARWSEITQLPWLLQAIGWLLVAAGGLVLVDSFVRFALQGLGTPAPVFPTKHLVVTGLYRFVRNPMYVAVVSLIFGQSLLLGNIRLLVYGCFIWLACHMFVTLYEEPTLRSTFHGEYDDFCSHVPRWIPRITPWQREASEFVIDR